MLSADDARAPRGQGRSPSGRPRPAELGIAAGLQDRVAQAYGGLTFMEFSSPPRFERVDVSLLTPLLVAWLPETAADSGPLHSDLGGRFERGEPEVTEGVAALAGAARAARATLLAGDVSEFGRCLDATFDARRTMLTLDPRHVEMIEVARACGAWANYTGSGGAVVAVCRDDARHREACQALRALGCESSTSRVLAR